MPECHNTNAIFNTYQPSSKEYKAELVRLLKQRDKEHIRYWIHSYENKNGKDYMHVYIQGDSLCSEGIIHFTNATTELKHFKDVKGVSYSGAELSGLQYRIIEDSAKNELEFIHVDDIID